MPPPRNNQAKVSISNLRFDMFYGLLILIFAVFIVRLFYVQVIKHEDYKQAALSGQLKQYSIPAERGIIEAYSGNSVVPIVLNEEVYTLFADPVYVADKKAVAEQLSKITGDKAKDYLAKMSKDTRYAVLAKKLDNKKKTAIEKLKFKGVGLRTESIRAYPQGDLAAQLLGFVNDGGQGTYGIEQFMDSQLAGTPGELKAITDIRGVPLVASKDNVLKDPVNGQKIRLTIEIGMQKKVEELLKEHLPTVNSKSGSAIVLDPNNGAIKAIANYPSYNPSRYFDVKDAALFTNPAVSSPLEVGSIMKTLTVATGLNSGAIKVNQTFYDPAQFTVDGYTIHDVAEDGGAQTRSISDILKFSLNSGATWIMMQLGGGQINEKARKLDYDYLTNHYFFGQKTGVEQGYEAPGVVPDPSEGFGLNIKYANMAFGQGLTVTPLQMAAAFAATINGGTYYQPHLVDDGKGAASKIKKQNIISPKISAQLRSLHENSVNTHYTSLIHPGYKIGGKTGTAQIAGSNGKYRTDVFNGTFIGYIGGDKPAYVIMIRINEPHVSYFAGAAAAAPLFKKISDMLIDNFSIPRAD